MISLNGSHRLALPGGRPVTGKTKSDSDDLPNPGVEMAGFESSGGFDPGVGMAGFEGSGGLDPGVGMAGFEGSGGLDPGEAMAGFELRSRRSRA